MAKAKEKPKALFAVKHEFYASLDNLSSEAIMLVQAVEMSIRSGKIPVQIADVLKERVEAFRAALTSSDE